jgi:hypothetical protein
MTIDYATLSDVINRNRGRGFEKPGPGIRGSRMADQFIPD